jgi:hypothetical protein
MIEIPSDVPEYMTDAWVSCLMWAAGEDKIVAAFSEQTGVPVPSTNGGICAMIDNATGLYEVFAHKFAEWFHANVWGKDSGQEAVAP